jgi:hypothetical protein
MSSILYKIEIKTSLHVRISSFTCKQPHRPKKSHHHRWQYNHTSGAIGLGLYKAILQLSKLCFVGSQSIKNHTNVTHRLLLWC